MTNRAAEQGYSLLEFIFVVGLMATITGVATPGILGAVDDFKTAGAVRYLSSRLQRTRWDAVSRSVNAAIRFTRDGEFYSYGTYADGNGDGVRSGDIQRGVDPQIQRDERLVDQFPGVEFGALPGLPAVDPSGPPPGTDPIRLGSSDMVAFTPLGTSTPGSLYVLGRNGTQYVIRVFGETGKVRILKFNVRSREWETR